MTAPDFVHETRRLLVQMGVDTGHLDQGDLIVTTPITGEIIARMTQHNPVSAQIAIDAAHDAFLQWRRVPAPKRGELVRLFGIELRNNKETLARLLSIEAGKILSEALGEVQEMIDICDFAVGLSRQLHGLTIASERAEHRMMESWHPLGVVGVISAFNFPVAVWAWNAALALVCGNSIVWKPSEKTPLTALAVQAMFERVASNYSPAPNALSIVLIGARDIGEVLVEHPKVPLVSATGSTAMGRIVGPKLASRFARAILELGGNNGLILCPSADLDMALRAIAFSAMGTAGQRCTTLRRLFVHNSIYDDFLPRLKRAYDSVTIGNPLEPGTLIGPLIDAPAMQSMQATLVKAKAQGGIITGGTPAIGVAGGAYVHPALVEMPAQTGPVLHECFAPILYVMRYDDLDSAIALHNAVPQGLSSAIFTNDIQEAELFIAGTGSDCGIANVNIGTSGAEIGGAFGGEKETGGGRESGSDSWKAYMRRATNTINYGRELPLAQGVSFDLG